MKFNYVFETFLYFQETLRSAETTLRRVKIETLPKKLCIKEKYPVKSFDLFELLERGLHGIREGV